MELSQGRWDEAAESAALVLAPTGPGLGPASVIALVTLGRLRARRGDPGQWAPLDEALALAERSGELLRLAPVAAARAEAAWLEGRPGRALAEATGAAFELAQRRRMRWLIGELAYWRWRAGIEEETPPGAAEPYALQIAGDWRRAAELWAELGCPYEAALALADADDDDAFAVPSRSCSDWARGPRRRSSRAACASAALAGCRADRAAGHGRTPPT